jgi:hypothetical protein
MKTTILLILVLACQVVNGQMSEEIEAYMDTTKYNLFGMEELGSFTNKEYIELKVVKLIVNSWDEYSIHCDFDSSKSVPRRCSYYGHDYCGLSHYQVIFVHTEPTLPGFMAYLKRKYGMK